MNIPTHAQEIVRQIQETPLIPATEFVNVNDNNFVQITAWILRNYSRTNSHKFLLKFNEIFIHLKLHELRKCVQLIDNDVLGLDNLTAFYFFFTDINTADFFETINIPPKIYNKYIGNYYQDNPFNKKLIISVGVTLLTFYLYKRYEKNKKHDNLIEK